MSITPGSTKDGANRCVLSAVQPRCIRSKRNGFSFSPILSPGHVLTRDVVCTGNVSPIQAGVPAIAGDKKVNRMPKLSIIYGLMALVGVIIVAVAVYVFTHLSGINMRQGIILVIIAIIALLIIMGVIFMLFKSLMAKK